MGGEAYGSFDGEALRISVFWVENKAHGQYEESIDSTGHLKGITKDLNKGNNPEVVWSSKQTFKMRAGRAPAAGIERRKCSEATLGIQSQHASWNDAVTRVRY